MTRKIQKLTGPYAWTLNARVERTWQEARFPDYMDVNDWRKHRAIAEGGVVDHPTYARRDQP